MPSFRCPACQTVTHSDREGMYHFCQCGTALGPEHGVLPAVALETHQEPIAGPDDGEQEQHEEAAGA